MATQPVCSDVTSLLHGHAKWVTDELLPLQKKQDSDFKDSSALIKTTTKEGLEAIGAFIIETKGDSTSLGISEPSLRIPTGARYLVRPWVRHQHQHGPLSIMHYMNK